MLLSCSRIYRGSLSPPFYSKRPILHTLFSCSLQSIYHGLSSSRLHWWFLAWNTEAAPTTTILPLLPLLAPAAHPYMSLPLRKSGDTGVCALLAFTLWLLYQRQCNYSSSPSYMGVHSKNPSRCLKPQVILNPIYRMLFYPYIYIYDEAYFMLIIDESAYDFLLYKMLHLFTWRPHFIASIWHFWSSRIINLVL